MAKKNQNTEEKNYSLNDDRRVKVLSPTAMVMKRFVRNRIAMVGMIILIAMFAFSFIGGLVSPYAEDQRFFKTDYQFKEHASAIKNEEFRYISADGADFSSILQAQMILAVQKGNESFSFGGKDYTVTNEGTDLYLVSEKDGGEVGIAYKDIISVSDASHAMPYALAHEILKAYVNGEPTATVDGTEYSIDDDGLVMAGDTEYAYVSRFKVEPFMQDVFLTRDFKEKLTDFLDTDGIDFTDADGVDFKYTNPAGEEEEYRIWFNGASKKWTVKNQKSTYVYDAYASPSVEHPLGTDRNGMDMLTRLMYGGRVSLVIGFIVEFIGTFLGIIFGGISGYFGGWVDNLIMRIVDVFYCIPSTPILIILGAAMDSQGVDPTLRMVYLMLILGFLSWPGVARMVRGQILSLREQEFMTATEACGIRASRRIFRHLIPNVIPQLIVSCTMGLGSTIITEATLSFLGLGVKFPFASWGNIINDVNNTFVLTNYWFIWIPAGCLLLLTVLAFNIVGDGLRDAFDPKMKR